MLREIIEEYKAAKRKIWPCHTNRASEIGHPCLRYLVFLRTHWDLTALPPVKTQFLFDEGKLHEEAVKRELQDAGIEVVETQRPYEWKKYKLTGHIDGKVKVNDELYPIEIKSVAPWMMDSINKLDDMWQHRTIHVRKWPNQLISYLAMDQKDEGILILKNRLTGELKDLPISYNIDYVDLLLHKCNKVNWYVSRRRLPGFDKDLDSGWCEDCKFAHICLPDKLGGKPFPTISDEELICLIEEHQKLKEYHKSYLELDRALNKKIEGMKYGIVGNWLIQGKWIDRKGFKVEPTKYWRKKITRL